MKKLLLILFISQFYLLTSVCASPNLAPVYSLLLDSSVVDESDNFQDANKVVSQNRGRDNYFGSSVAIYGDYAIVGSPNEDYISDDPYYIGSVFDAGAAYLYKLNSSTKEWNLIERIFPKIDGARFGYCVAINENYIVIGARDENIIEGEFSHGAIYIYENYKQGIDTPVKISPAIEHSWFGSSVAISNHKIVVGSTFGHNSAGGKATDSDKNYGAAYIYTKGNNSWELEHIIVPDEPGIGYVNSVSIYNNYITVGSFADGSDLGAGYAYYYTNGNWTENGSFPTTGREGVIVSNKVLVSNSFLFVTAYLGAHSFNGMRTGFVNVYKRDASNTFWQLLQKIEPVDMSSNPRFGADISISNDEKTLAISDSGTNKVYLYSQTLTGWSLDQNVTQFGEPSSLSFGTGVATTNSSLLVGDKFNDHDANGENKINAAGAAYFFGTKPVIPTGNTTLY